MSGIIVGLVNGLVTPDWVLWFVVPVFYGTVMGVWQGTIGDLPGRSSVRASAGIGGRAASGSVEAAVVEGALHAFVALMGTGLGLALRVMVG
ncbi:MAG: hypothetical protein ACOC71_04055 [Hyphomicrobiales bacterium]